MIDQTIRYLFGDKGYRGHDYQGETKVVIETSKNRKKYKVLLNHHITELLSGF